MARQSYLAVRDFGFHGPLRVARETETEGERERGERREKGFRVDPFFATRVKRDHPAAPVFERF